MNCLSIIASCFYLEKTSLALEIWCCSHRFLEARVARRWFEDRQQHHERLGNWETVKMGPFGGGLTSKIVWLCLVSIVWFHDNYDMLIKFMYVYVIIGSFPFIDVFFGSRSAKQLTSGACGAAFRWARAQVRFRMKSCSERLFNGH